MLSLEELSKQTSEYQAGRIDVEDFEDWFRIHSRGAYSRRGDPLSAVVAAVEAVLSRYHFENADDASLQMELANAVRHFGRW